MKDIENSNHNYGVDLLRIIAMLMIISHHIFIHGGIDTDCITGAKLLFLKGMLPLGGKPVSMLLF